MKPKVHVNPKKQGNISESVLKIQRNRF